MQQRDVGAGAGDRAEDVRCVVEKHVDPGDLLQHGKRDTQKQHAAQTGSHEFSEIPTFMAKRRLYFGDLTIGMIPAIDLGENGACFFHPTLAAQESRAFGHKEQGYQQHQGWHRLRSEHPSPTIGIDPRLVALAGDVIIDEIYNQHSKDDGKLVE